MSLPHNSIEVNILEISLKILLIIQLKCTSFKFHRCRMTLGPALANLLRSLQFKLGRVAKYLS